MSVSAESVDSVHCKSSSLLSILDQVFQPKNKTSTTPTSIISSPKRNSLFNSQSNRSVSPNNSSPATKLVVSVSKNKISTTPTSIISSPKCNSLFNSQSNCSVSPDNSSPVTELVISNCNHEEEDKPGETNSDIEVITEENTSFSEVIISSYIKPNNNFVDIIPNSPLKRTIVKPLLKKSYSFNDIDIRRIITLNKKSESVQTFTSTNATLSVEIEICQDSGNNQSVNNINLYDRLINRERRKNKEIIKRKIKEILLKNKPKYINKKIIINNLFDDTNFVLEKNEKNQFNKNNFTASIKLNLFKRIKMLNYSEIKYCYCNFLNINSIDNEYNDDSANVNYTFENSDITDQFCGGDCGEVSVKMIENLKRKNRIFGQGDEKSETSELACETYEESCDAEQEILLPQEIAKKVFNFSKFSNFIRNPLILTSIFFGGMLILIPTYGRLSKWLSSAINPLPILPSLKIEKTIPIKNPSTSYLSRALLNNKKTFNLFFSHSPLHLQRI